MNKERAFPTWDKNIKTESKTVGQTLALKVQLNA